jgi:phosphoketolase
LIAEGCLLLNGNPENADVILAATGSYQLNEVLRAQKCLAAAGIAAAVVYIGEPGRLRIGRDAREAAYVLTDKEVARYFPADMPRVFVTQTRPEPYLGALRRIDTGPQSTRALGFVNQGGTLDIAGLLFANRCTWGHTVAAALAVLDRPLDDALHADEQVALAGRGDPQVITRPATGQ